jgi:hypothetical protein
MVSGQLSANAMVENKSLPLKARFDTHNAIAPQRISVDTVQAICEVTTRVERLVTAGTSLRTWTTVI